MADVKWIKLSTEIFDNRKIKQIETLPDGDSLIVIWFKILCLAGNTNDNGFVYFTHDIPYTDQMLATEFNRPLATVKLALNTFKRFEMIDIVDNIIHVSSWEKYQNVDGLEKIKEQNRIRQARFKEKQKLLSSNVIGNVTDNVTVTDGNATDIDIDIDTELDKDKKREKEQKKKKEQKHKYGAYQHVLLTDSDMNKLINELGNEMYSKCITFLDEYIEMKGYKAKSHYLAIRKWVFNAVKEQELRNNKMQRLNTNYNAPIDWYNV